MRVPGSRPRLVAVATGPGQDCDVHAPATCCGTWEQTPAQASVERWGTSSTSAASRGTRAGHR